MRERQYSYCVRDSGDFFLWGFVKFSIHANQPTTIPELKEEIRRVIGEIGGQMCEYVISNLSKRARVCPESWRPFVGFHT